MERVCAWCTRRMRTTAEDNGGGLVSHGLCATCAGESGAFETEDVAGLSEAELDRLPLGVVRVDAQGTVLAYNEAEERLARTTRETVLGRNFFTEVAPCTHVADFHGRFVDMVRAGRTAREQLDFVFRFAHGDRFVQIVMAYDAERAQALLLVSATD